MSRTPRLIRPPSGVYNLHSQSAVTWNRQELKYPYINVVNWINISNNPYKITQITTTLPVVLYIKAKTCPPYNTIISKDKL